jgi:hypothetical protein
MPIETIEIDARSLSGQRELMAWCIYPSAPDKRDAYIAALEFEDATAVEAAGESVPPWPWQRVKALASQHGSPEGILKKAEKAWEHATTAAIMAERLLEGRETKTKEGGAADAVAVEMQAYYKRKTDRGNMTNKDDVVARMWGPYKPVAHLALALTELRRESVLAALPHELRTLPPDEVSDLLWRYEEGDPETRAILAKPLSVDPGPQDWGKVLERAEERRIDIIRHSKIRIRDEDTIKFVAAPS